MLFESHQGGELLLAEIAIEGFLASVRAYVNAAEVKSLVSFKDLRGSGTHLSVDKL